MCSNRGTVDLDRNERVATKDAMTVVGISNPRSRNRTDKGAHIPTEQLPKNLCDVLRISSRYGNVMNHNNNASSRSTRGGWPPHRTQTSSLRTQQ
jgi:hypothetical protein